MKEKIIRIATHIIVLLLALIGGLLGIADQIHAIPFIPAQFTKYWAIFVAAAPCIKPLLLIIGDWLDDGIINKSFKGSGLPLAIIALFLCAGCVNVKENGKTVFHCSANAAHISFTSPAGTKLVIDTFNPGATHRAIGASAGQIILAGGTAVATSGVISIIK